MDTEFEAKYYVTKDDARARLEKAGAKLVAPERLMRIVIYDQEFHPNFSCHFTRIRDEGSKVTMSAKTHTKTGKMADEKEDEVLRLAANLTFDHNPFASLPKIATT